MTAELSTAHSQILDRAGELIAEAFGLAERIAAIVTETFTMHEAVRRTDLTRVGSLVMPVLKDRRCRVQGAGFVAAVDALADSRWWLEWFMRAANGSPERLLIDTDPRGENFYDYESLPWYDVPRGTGHRHITGPYVDYLCTDDYTLTFTVPIHHGDKFIGVAGADLKVFTFEKAVLPCLRAAGRTMAIVNAQGRVVLSNSARHVSGTLLKATSPGYQLEDLPLVLVDLG